MTTGTVIVNDEFGKMCREEAFCVLVWLLGTDVSEKRSATVNPWDGDIVFPQNIRNNVAATGWKVRGSNSFGDKGFLRADTRPYRSWSSPGLRYGGHRAFFPDIKLAGHPPHLAPWWSMNRAIPLTFYAFSDMLWATFTLPTTLTL